MRWSIGNAYNRWAFGLAIVSAATIAMDWNLDTMLPFDLASRSRCCPTKQIIEQTTREPC